MNLTTDLDSNERTILIAALLENLMMRGPLPRPGRYLNLDRIANSQFVQRISALLTKPGEPGDTYTADDLARIVIKLVEAEEAHKGTGKALGSAEKTFTAADMEKLRKGEPNAPR